MNKYVMAIYLHIWKVKMFSFDLSIPYFAEWNVLKNLFKYRMYFNLDRNTKLHVKEWN